MTDKLSTELLIYGDQINTAMILHVAIPWRFFLSSLHSNVCGYMKAYYE